LVGKNRSLLKFGAILLVLTVGVSLIRLQQQSSKQVWTPSSTVQIVDLGNILMEPSAKFIGHVYHVFRERNLNGGAEN